MLEVQSRALPGAPGTVTKLTQHAVDASLRARQRLSVTQTVEPMSRQKWITSRLWAWFGEWWAFAAPMFVIETTNALTCQCCVAVATLLTGLQYACLLPLVVLSYCLYALCLLPLFFCLRRPATQPAAAAAAGAAAGAAAASPQPVLKYGTLREAVWEWLGAGVVLFFAGSVLWATIPLPQYNYWSYTVTDEVSVLALYALCCVSFAAVKKMNRSVRSCA